MTEQYAIGFFEGEGTIVHHHSALEVHVTQCRLNVLQAFKKKYGGQIVVQREGPTRIHRSPGVWRKVWRWRLVGYAAAKFLEDALPYLLVKRERAQAALLWWKDRVAGRQRLRMPNDYYKEHPESRRLQALSPSQKKKEIKKREAWMKKKGWTS